LIDRPKSGFNNPFHTWLRGSLRDWSESLLDEKRLKSEGFFEPGPVRE
jgi:asparagine synthase (glutamine-hydrolysing)